MEKSFGVEEVALKEGIRSEYIEDLRKNIESAINAID